ncbi:MAG: MerR family transcriptional regulator [Chloroflexi bacterium]|nr:MerR family transcriptional regulator [Chloroflexota bacterium]MBK89844.1 MerR family transcriptional regulator [Chloroflexota bacterium]|tara:strand:+ start:116339 stop:116779 length:441 start_codon:yes stop_codon:yes gene_type:complete
MVNRGWIVSKSLTVSNIRSENDSTLEVNSDPVVGVYTISVASHLISMHPNTLRKYDRNGLVKPSRTDGRRRLYSENDLLRLRIVKLLTERYGLNLEGAKLVLALSIRIKEVVDLLEQGVNNQVYKNSAKVASKELRQLFLDLGIKI